MISVQQIISDVVAGMRTKTGLTYPVFEHGRIEYIHSKMNEKLSGDKLALPMIALVGDFKEPTNIAGKEITLPILFAVETKPETSNPDRYNTTFPTLYSLLEAFNEALGDSVYIDMSYPDYDKLDSSYYTGDKNKFNIYTDVLVCEYKVYILNDCTTFIAPETVAITLQAETGGTTVPAPAVLNVAYKSNNAFYAIVESGYRFAGWLMSGITTLTNPLPYIATATATLKAQFIKVWQLTTSVSGEGTITPSSGINDESNITIEVTPTNPLTHTFDKIELTPDGEATETILTNPYTFLLNKAYDVVGYIRAILQNFTLTITKTGNGTVDPDVGEHICVEGTPKTITAYETDPDYYLDGIYEGGVNPVSNPYVWNPDQNRTFEARFLAWQKIMDVFSTVPTLVGNDYVYEDITTEGNNVIVTGSNYAYFDNTQNDIIKFETKYVIDGDVISFWAKRGVATNENIVLFGSPNSRQIKFNASNGLIIYAGTLNTFTSVATTTNWNYYKIFFDEANLRVGLSVNNAAYTYKSNALLGGGSYFNSIGAQTAYYSEISLFNLEWKDSLGNYKYNMPFSEGYGIPFNKVILGNIMLSAKHKYLFESTLPPFNEINHFRKQPAKRRLIYLFGQSNMTGQNFASVNSIYNSPQQHYYAFSSTTYNQYALGGLRILSEYNNYASIEMSAGIDLTFSGDEVIFIKVDYPGSDLHTGWQKGGYQYTTQAAPLIAAVKANLANNGFEYEESEIWLLLGETYTGDVSNSDNFYNDFVQMIHDMVTDGILGSELPVVIGKLSNTPYSYEAVVNDAYDRIVANYGGAVIETSDIPKNVDNIHYPATSLITLGKRFAANFIAQNYTVLTSSKIIYIPSYDVTTACNGKVLTNISGFGSESVVVIPTNADIQAAGLTAGENSYADLDLLTQTNELRITKTANNISRIKVRKKQ